MATVSLLKRFQAAADSFYNVTYYSGSISVQAHREGMDKGLRGTALAQFVNERRASPPDSYNAKAVAEARRLTARRKLRGKYIGLLAAIVWLSSGFYLFSTTNVASLFSFAAIGYFVIGVFVATLFIGGLFQILFGFSNFLQLGIIAVVEWVIGRVLNNVFRLSIVSYSRVWLLAPKLIFGAALFTVEALVTFLVAHWVFEHFV